MKIKLLLLTICALFVLIPKTIYAKESNFDISTNSSYNINEDGITTLTQNISIKNKTEFYYTPSYSISIGFKNIENIQAYGKEGSIPFTLDDSKTESKNIKLTFTDKYTGLGTINNFTLKFDTKDIAKKQGSVWEISIPGIAKPEDFISHNSSITVPKSFGPPKIIKPQKSNTDQKTVTFSKSESGKAGIFLIYGEKQYYSFSLSYHISNPNLFPVKTEIALPPQTNYQNVIITSFSTFPSNVTRDGDGNWIAQYQLLPQQRKTVIVKGMVEILSDANESQISNAKIEAYLTPRKYWEVMDGDVQKTAKALKTPREIYDFVTSSLTYNYDKVSGENKRLGAKGTLLNKKNSVCMEFTDLFVALARASGIPARGVEGFGYTENSTLRPLSLVDDVLHTWPEYYDKDKRKWIMVDPTWGNTTRGMDYFNTLDFEHIVFVIKGYDSEYPIPAGGYKFENKSKDVEVQFANAQDFKPFENLIFSDTFPNSTFPGLAISGSFTVKNTSNTPLIGKSATVTSSLGAAKQFFIDYIPPGGYKTINLEYKNAPFLTNRSLPITIQIGSFTYTKKVAVSLIPDLTLFLLFGGIIGGSITVAIITYYTGSLFVQRRKRQNTLRGKGQKP